MPGLQVPLNIVRHRIIVAELRGITTDLQGGKFGHGFLSAGVGFWTGLKFGGAPNFGRFLASAIAGGTISEITGGKFGNGAISAGLAYVTAAAMFPGSGEGEWVFPEGGSTDLNDCNTVVTGGILESSRDEFAATLIPTEAGYFNPSHGIFADLIESLGQKFFGWAGDPLAAGLARGLAGVDHPMTIIAHSQGTLTVTNAVRYYGLSAKGSTFEMRSPALSYFTASRAINGRGGTIDWRQPLGDIANLYAPSFNPLRWISGFGDILCGACRHTANGHP